MGFGSHVPPSNKECDSNVALFLGFKSNELDLHTFVAITRFLGGRFGPKFGGGGTKTF